MWIGVTLGGFSGELGSGFSLACRGVSEQKLGQSLPASLRLSSPISSVLTDISRGQV